MTALPADYYDHWNYRVMLDRSGRVGIREVYYNNDGEIVDWTTERMDPWGETIEELKLDLDKFNEALDKPVLDEVALLQQRRKEHL